MFWKVHVYSFDFDEFICRVKHLGYDEMVRAADREAADVESSLYGRGKVALMKQEAGGREYRRLLSGFLYLLYYGSKPDGVSEWDFPRMRPAIEGLVQRGIMKSEALGVFGTQVKTAS